MANGSVQATGAQARAAAQAAAGQVGGFGRTVNTGAKGIQNPATATKGLLSA